MKHLLTILSIAVCCLLVACGTSDGLTKAERSALQAQKVLNALESGEYTIEVNWMHPLRGQPQHLTYGYRVKVKGDTIDSYLPYFGGAYYVPYGGGKGLNFTAPISDYRIEQTANNHYIVYLQTNIVEDTYLFQIDLFTNGKASIYVIARERDNISFDGEMVF